MVIHDRIAVAPRASEQASDTQASSQRRVPHHDALEISGSIDLGVGVRVWAAKQTTSIVAARLDESGVRRCSSGYPRADCWAVIGYARYRSDAREARKNDCP